MIFASHFLTLCVRFGSNQLVNPTSVSLAGLDQAGAPGEESHLQVGDPKLKSLDTVAVVLLL